MNFHFIFFLLDILVWVAIAALLCSQLFIKKSYRVNLSKMTIINVIILSLGAGFFSVLIHGIPDLGFSINSIAYASLAPLGLIIYKQRPSRNVDKFKNSKYILLK